MLLNVSFGSSGVFLTSSPMSSQIALNARSSPSFSPSQSAKSTMTPPTFCRNVLEVFFCVSSGMGGDRSERGRLHRGELGAHFFGATVEGSALHEIRKHLGGRTRRRVRIGQHRVHLVHCRQIRRALE